MALSHKKKTVGRPPDWPEETDSDAKWEKWAWNEVIWEEMINSSGNVREVYSEEDTDSIDQTGIKEVHDDQERVDRLAEIWTKLGLEKNEIL